ncbi:hypothetical protein [Chryseobacterium sp. RU37D]|uniref:hypothetical protein n=1 Tax=Chryseobacterium sp. RU37D TaxID=1907397 RepID=UPI001180FC90|nr:hypothetical protein [Chryseobacterium sp. RU37D]
MAQNENPKLKKKNGCLKIILIFFGVCFFLGIIGKLINLDKLEADSKKADNSPLIEKLEKVGYPSLNLKEKKEVLNYFIRGEFQFKDKNFLLNQNINDAISKSLKFPETLQIKGFDNEYHKDYEVYTNIQGDATIISYENGIFEIVREFKAEGNIVGREIRKSATFKCKLNRFAASIEDFKIE